MNTLDVMLSGQPIKPSEDAGRLLFVAVPDVEGTAEPLDEEANERGYRSGGTWIERESNVPGRVQNDRFASEEAAHVLPALPDHQLGNPRQLWLSLVPLGK